MFHSELRTQNSRKPHGITRVEVLAVVLVIVALMALVLPAGGFTVGLAGRMTCTNKVINLGRACLEFEAQHKRLPAGVTSCGTEWWRYVSTGKIPCQGPNWITAILVYLEEKDRYDAVQQCMVETSTVCTDCPRWTAVKVTAFKGHGVGTHTPAPFRCPEDKKMKEAFRLDAGNMPKLSKGNYAACFGADYYKTSSREFRGAFSVVPSPRIRFNQVERNVRWHVRAFEYDYFDFPVERTKGRWKNNFRRGTELSDIRDGKAKTLLASEVVGAESAKDGRGAWMWPGMGGAAFTALHTPNSGKPDGLALCEVKIPKDKPLHCTRAEDEKTHAAARSYHLGGVNAVYCDGSVRFVSDKIDVELWWAQSTIKGFFYEIEPDPDIKSWSKPAY